MNNQLDQFLLLDLSEIIENGKLQAAKQVNSTLTCMYWQIGYRINTHLLENQRAEYGKEVVISLSKYLVAHYGTSFQEKNLRRMIQFACNFTDFEIVVTLSRQLSWSHFLCLIPIKTRGALSYYLDKICQERWSVRETRRQIDRKAYERNEIAKAQSAETANVFQQTFKDPYILDFLDLKTGFLENDLEGAILRELENFILELGKGFAFVERQKRIIVDEEDFYIDLLFYHRQLKRLVAIELKLGKFKAAYKGQMELYLKWLDKYERHEGENHPIGLILCAEKSKEQIELLELGNNGIMVAEYWTELPPKKVLEEKLHQSLINAQERLSHKSL